MQRISGVLHPRRVAPGEAAAGDIVPNVSFLLPVVIR